jgi:hypothetical protein
MRDLVVLLAALVLWVGLLQVPNLGLAGFVPGQTAWDTIFENDPDNTDTVSEGDDHIRQTKTLIRNRAEVEHGWGTGLGEGVDDTGRHREGSAQCFYQAGAPTDLAAADTAGLTALDATDDGRCWIDSDTGELWVWSGADWNTAIGPSGRQTVWLPAASMFPATTSGATGPTQIEIVAGQPELLVLEFLEADDSFAQFQIKMPQSWDAGPILFGPVFTPETALDAQVVVFTLSCLSLANGETINQAFPAPTSLTSGALTESINDQVDLTPVAHTPLGPAASAAAKGETLWCRLGRDVAAVDTSDDNLRVIGMWLLYDTDAPTDD